MYGYSVVVKPDGLDMERAVNVSLAGEDVKSALTKIFSGQPVDIDVNGKNVSVKKAEVQSIPQNTIAEITGIIKDEFGEPLIGASVLIKDKPGEGTITDLDGAYALKASPGDVFVISYIGYKSVEVAVADNKTINASLLPDTEFLEATVVVGYGVQKKVNLSGSVSAVNLEETGELRAVTNLSSSLQGVTSGMLAQQSSGEPGADEASVTIRGMGTLNNSSPLVVIDGIIGSMSDVNPNDVASMSVLKDAASSAIYGSRAANGVILITTKSGKEGQSKITYNGKAGWSQVAMPIDVVSDYVQYMNTINQASANAGSVMPFGKAIIREWQENQGKNEIYCNTNWFDEIFKPSFQTDHNLQFSGGNKSINYMVSLGYLQNNGTMKGTGYQRYSIRSNINADVTKWL